MIYSQVFKYIIKKKSITGKVFLLEKKKKKSGIQKLGSGRLELAHAAIIPSPCGIILYAEIKQNAEGWEDM